MASEDRMDRALQDIANERALQDRKWGTNQKGQAWTYRISILTEEVGEAAAEANDAHTAKDGMDRIAHMRNLRAELVQVAAVAVKTIEMIDADGWS